jgi:hypothetical protein
MENDVEAGRFIVVDAGELSVELPLASFSLMVPKVSFLNKIAAVSLILDD